MLRGGWVAMSSATADGGTRIDGPAELSRTDPSARERTSKFDVTLNTAISDIETEMDRLEVDDWRLDTAMDHQSQDPNYPYASQPEPEDSGVVLRWSMDGDQFAIACDRWVKVRDNAREIGLYVKEKRKMENRPVTTGQSEFATARLPSAEEDAIVATEPPHDVLDVAPDAPPEVVRAAFRAKIQDAHLDQGGSQAEFERVGTAKEELIGDE